MASNPPYYISAYALAVKHGFTGTIDQWLASLKGDRVYLYIKYSAAEPEQDSDMKDTPDAWMGVQTSYSATAGAHYTDYTWYNIKGTTGNSSYQAAVEAGYTGTEAEYQEECASIHALTLAAISATGNANTAAAAANTAKTAADTAAANATTAAGAANTAATAAANAAASANGGASSANNATVAANNAAASANTAAAAANTAKTAADTAAANATTAAGTANAAATAATNAAASANGAANNINAEMTTTDDGTTITVTDKNGTSRSVSVQAVTLGTLIDRDDSDKVYSVTLVVEDGNLKMIFNEVTP